MEDINCYYIYILRCMDESLYTGIAKNVERRFEEHKSKGKKCAKYTRTHDAKKIEAIWKTDNKKNASKMEFHIKRLNKDQKEEIIKKGNIEKFLKDKIDCDLYEKIK